jgi:hypothetical protein
MSYPASTKTLQKWVQEIDEKAVFLKAAAQQQSSLSSANQLNMDAVRRFFDLLVSVNVYFTSAASVTGLANYLIAEKQNQTADPFGDFTTMRNAVTATLDWLRTNVPEAVFSGSTYKLGFLFPSDNVTASSSLTFTAAQTAGYRTALTSLIATIA